MGTNYYAFKKLECSGPCEHCSVSEDDPRTHLGKSSFGWKFIFRAQSTWGKGAALDDWLDLVDNADHIEDEYGMVLSKDEFLARVMRKQHGRSHNAEYPSDQQHTIGGFDFSWHEFH